MYTRLLALVAAFVAVCGCGTAQVNPNDSTPPIVVFKVKQGNSYVPVNQVLLNGTPADQIACDADDPQGIKSIELTYNAPPGNTCTVSTDNPQPGSFQVLNVPQPQSASTQPNAQNEVPEGLILLETLPVFWKCQASGQDGYLNNHTVTAVCIARNWSNNQQASSTQATLALKSQN